MTEAYDVRESIGFIGLGIMGAPMVANLVRSGHPVVVYDRNREAVDRVVGHGAVSTGSSREVAQQSELTITMLPDSPQVLEVMSDVLEEASPGQLLIDMSTIAPSVSRELATRAAEKDVQMLDAPVSGGDVGAREGTLSIMVGGSEAAYQRALPLFQVMGSTITRVGEAGAGQVVKACNQVVVALVIEAVSEALVLGSKAGVSPEMIIRVLSGGLAANRVMELRGRNFLEHDFTPGFKVDLHHKDLGIALQTARSCGVVLPASAAVDQMLESLRLAGHGGEDHSALLRVVEELSRHVIGTGATPVQA